jgi:hypothetical protein
MPIWNDITDRVRETYISEDERLSNFNEWYKKYGKGRSSRPGIPKGKRTRDYKALRSVWEVAGSPLISDEAYTEKYGKKFPGRPHTVDKPFYYGSTGFGRDAIYSIKNYEDLFAELAHTSVVKDKGILARFIDKKRYALERDDPSPERIRGGDVGMYDKIMLDFPDWAEKLGFKDWWSLETQAHGESPRYLKEVGLGREKILAKQYKDLYSLSLKEWRKIEQ